MSTRVITRAIAALAVSATLGTGGALTANATALTVPSATSHLATSKQKCEDAITRRLATLVNYTSDVGNLRWEDRARLLAIIKSDRDGLGALRMKIKNDRDPQAVMTHCRAVLTDYRIYVLLGPQIHLTLAAEGADRARFWFYGLYTTIYPRVQNCTADSQVCHAVRQAWDHLTSKANHAEDAWTGAGGSNLIDRILALKPADYPGTTTTLDRVRSVLRTVRMDLQAARTDVKAILADLKAVGPAPTPKPLPYGGPGGSWNLKFSDEFNGISLDLSKWHPNWFGATHTSITHQFGDTCADPAQVRVASGELDITAVARRCNGHRYASGLINSNGHYSFTYGYQEARIWTPAGAGLWPAFWSDGQNWPANGEIDTLEATGGDYSEYHFHHAGCGGDCGPGGGINIPSATAGWHTYASEWEPGSITWYYDGKQVWQFTGTAVTSAPMYLIVNLAVQQGTSPPVPRKMRIDYVRVWQRISAGA